MGIVSSFFRKKRAQAAIELLTTYGWAIIGVLIVIGALSYFDVFDAKRFVSERCDTGSQIQCTGAYLNTGGNFELELKNNYLVPIDIEKVQVTSGSVIDASQFKTLHKIAGYPNTYTTIGPGNNTRFRIENYNYNLHKGSKEEITVIITFRRSTSGNMHGQCGNLGGATCYNITGSLISKVLDYHDVAPPPS